MDAKRLNRLGCHLMQLQVICTKYSSLLRCSLLSANGKTTSNHCGRHCFEHSSWRCDLQVGKAMFVYQSSGSGARLFVSALTQPIYARVSFSKVGMLREAFTVQ